MECEIRPERLSDAQIIRQVTEAAFAVAEHSSGTEGAIVDSLRRAKALTVSLVATIDDEVVGHVAFSPVTIDGANIGWFGLGPISVRPDLHGKGIGGVLIRHGLEHLRKVGAQGCVVLGNPEYYQRFGFQHDPAVRYEGAPAEYFMRMSFDGSIISGSVAYHEGFSAS
jgi:putative acetyltransferase